MSCYFLTGLKVEGFRGINNENQPLELKFKADSVNSIFASNASGKSSIFEALSFAIRGHVPRLKALQAAERPEAYVANLFHSTKRALVELELEDETGTRHLVRVTRTADGSRHVSSPSGLADPQGVLTSLNEDFTLLDYEQFQSFINRTPLERGRTFAPLLGLSGYSQLRQLLQGLCDRRNLNADFDLGELRSSASSQESGVREALSRFSTAYNALTGLAISDTPDLPQWGIDVRDALSGVGILSSAIGTRKLSEIDFEALRGIIRREEGGPTRDELAKLVARSTELSAVDVEPTHTAATSAQELRNAVQKRAELLAATPGVNYQRLHEAGRDLYQSQEWHDPKVCALCKSELAEPVLSQIETEVQRFEDVRRNDKKLRELADAPWVNCLSSLEAIPEITDDATPLVNSQIVGAAAMGTLTEASVETALSRLHALAEKLDSVLAAMKTRITELERELPPSLVAVTAQVEHAAVCREALTAYWQHSRDLEVTQAKLAKYDRWEKFITGVTDEICDAEARHASARLDALSSDYKSLFQAIMGVDDVVPTLSRASESEQLELRLQDFHGLADLSARALLSESYRNALAVSVILSTAAQQKTAARFVVLDDVTSSFDAGHQWRLMDQLRTNLQHKAGGDGLQFIILSHDGLLEKYFDKVAGGGDWHHQRLQGWPPLGAVSVVSQDADRLRKTAVDFLNAGRVKEAEPLVRQYLEFTLLRVIRKVNIPVPFDFSIKDQLQMVGNSLDAIDRAVKLQGAAGGLVLTSSQVTNLQAMIVPALIGNWVSHYSTAVSANLSPPVLLGVVQAADDLSEIFKYDDGANPPVRRWYRSLTAK